MAYAWATLGATNGPFTNADGDVIQNIVAAYDMNKHCTTNTHYSGLMTSEFIDRHFVVGPPERCIARLRALEALGVSRFYIVTSPMMDASACWRRPVMNTDAPAAKVLAAARPMPEVPPVTTTTLLLKSCAMFHSPFVGSAPAAPVR
jgi:hypothetical protein